MIWGPRNTEKGFLFLAAGVSRHGGSGFAIFSPSGAHLRQNLNGKKVPTHRPICPLTCSTLVPLCSTHLGPPELLMATKHIFGHFQPPRSPLMAISERKNGPNPPAHMSPHLFQPCSTSFHPFGASRTRLWPMYPNVAIFGQFLAIKVP